MLRSALKRKTCCRQSTINRSTTTIEAPHNDLCGALFFIVRLDIFIEK
jgi:hypothetical protein